MNAKEHLTAARALLAPGPECWIKGSFARDASGRSGIGMTEAVCWCALGAVWEVGGREHLSEAQIMLRRVVQETTRFNTIASFSDHPATTHADVLRVYDLAIAAAGEEF